MGLRQEREAQLGGLIDKADEDRLEGRSLADFFARQRDGWEAQRAAILEEIERLSSVDHVVRALHGFEQGAAGFADDLIGERARNAGCKEVYPFDLNLQRGSPLVRAWRREFRPSSQASIRPKRENALQKHVLEGGVIGVGDTGFEPVTSTV